VYHNNLPLYRVVTLCIELVANTCVEQQAAASIVQGLGYLPLAVVQAGAYIHMQQYSFSRYLREYRTNSHYILSGKWKAVGKQDESVFATLELSFDAIQKQNPRAAELLLLCGFMDNEDIPEELLRRGMNLSADGMRNTFLYIYIISYTIPQPEYKTPFQEIAHSMFAYGLL